MSGRNYKLSAVLEDGAVKSKIKWRDRAGAGEEHNFTADTSFMTSLQELVSKYNFAQYNGYISKVSGLPDMYGAKLDTTMRRAKAFTPIIIRIALFHLKQ